MRLLYLSRDGGYRLTESLNDDALPPYAILSHTWFQTDNDEPTFSDLENGSGKEKPGYKKLQFCGEQAQRDDLQYFWVDTCCINKDNNSELSDAISSMFRFYRNSHRCYVYLSDVQGDYTEIQRSWDSDFYKSRWFTRGWTLQELLAPRSVEFFSSIGTRLGDRLSLAQQIAQITSIPEPALRGHPLPQFSREERFRWMSSRKTGLPEDKAYSLLGIFDVEIPVAYSEGAGSAMRRLEEAIERRDRCIRDIRLRDPRDDKARIEKYKGGLLDDVYRWILQNHEFRQWRSAEQSSLLWIKGEPGKGKTMLLCGIINELKNSSSNTPVLSYFFCQATDPRANKAAAVLRGLIFMFVCQHPSLVSYIYPDYDTSGKEIFEDVNAWFVLSRIMRSMLKDPKLDGAYVIIDALDECSEDQPQLLDFIVASTSIYSCTRWIVSSRNWPNIEKALTHAAHGVKLSLELNEESISAAVNTYIHIKVEVLAKKNGYNQDEQDTVQHNLEHSAHGTFLWVALVCQVLLDVAGWEARDMSKEFPPELGPLYNRMMQQISRSRRSSLCKEVLAIASVARRPLTLEEMSSFVSRGPPISGHYKDWVDIVESCGSFLTLRKNVISFVHQSAKDFLVGQAYRDVFPSGIECVHYAIVKQSLRLMSGTLRKDMYNLKDPGFSVDQDSLPTCLDPLATVRYSCVYWIEHLQESGTAKERSILSKCDIKDFLRKYYLYWLEASSLCGSMSNAQVSMAKLESLLQREVC